MAQSGQSMDWPGIAFDLSRVLHGEQYIELFGQLPSDGAKLRSETRVLDILDKKKAALIIKEGELGQNLHVNYQIPPYQTVTTYDERTGQKLAVQEFGIFQSGAGDFGVRKEQVGCRLQ
jgi:(3R)-3-hydroxyacyl-CoA dehydrogenase / 3a,7a,12a-trihydroxy-5b-cholest-24-enoyl-CoA hydratase / enoyl-CoA hydratase 2